MQVNSDHCCITHNADFTVVPQSEVVILEGGEFDLYCVHPTQSVTWYKADTLINENSPESCDCFVTVVQGVEGANLTFSNFTAESAGEYSCRATLSDNTELICGFNVSAGKLHTDGT